MFSRDFNEIFHKYATDKEIFHELMPLRTREILLVAPAFDAFTLEQDGLLTEILFDGYYQLKIGGTLAKPDVKPAGGGVPANPFGGGSGSGGSGGGFNFK